MGEQLVAALDHSFGRGRGIRRSHGVAQGDERGGGAGGRIAGGVLEVDPLIVLRGVRQVAGGLVGDGQGKVAIGLRKIGVALAEQAHGIGGGTRSRQTARLQYHGFRGERG